MFEYVQHSPIVDSSQFITKLLLYSVPGDTFAYQSQSNIVFTSFYKVNISIEDLHVCIHVVSCTLYQCAVPNL